MKNALFPDYTAVVFLQKKVAKTPTFRLFLG